MQLRIEQIRACLQAFDFKKLFIQELGWDKHSANLPVAVDGKVFNLHAIAEKRGMQVFELMAPSTRASRLRRPPQDRAPRGEAGSRTHHHLHGRRQDGAEMAMGPSGTGAAAGV